MAEYNFRIISHFSLFGRDNSISSFSNLYSVLSYVWRNFFKVPCAQQYDTRHGYAGSSAILASAPRTFVAYHFANFEYVYVLTKVNKALCVVWQDYRGVTAFLVPVSKSVSEINKNLVMSLGLLRFIATRKPSKIHCSFLIVKSLPKGP
jgi:hypothetical protein